MAIDMIQAVRKARACIESAHPTIYDFVVFRAERVGEDFLVLIRVNTSIPFGGTPPKFYQFTIHEEGEVTEMLERPNDKKL